MTSPYLDKPLRSRREAAFDLCPELGQDITALREALAELADIVEGVYEGVAGCKIDSFTTQPARQTLAATEPEAQPLYPFCTHCTWDRGKLVKQDPACPIHGTKGKADEN